MTAGLDEMRTFYQANLTMDRDELGAHLLSIHCNALPDSCGAPSGEEYLAAMSKHRRHWAWGAIDGLIAAARQIPCPHCGQLYDPDVPHGTE